MTHICVSKLTIIASDNGLSPGRRKAIISTNAGMLLIGPLGTNLSEILFELYTFPFKKSHLKMVGGKWEPFCLGLNVLNWSKWFDIEKNGLQMKCLNRHIAVNLQHILWCYPPFHYWCYICRSRSSIVWGAWTAYGHAIREYYLTGSHSVC